MIATAISTAPNSNASIRNVLMAHACAEFMRGAAASLTLILPFIARRHFGASNTQMWLLTVAVPAMQLFTIFWHRAFANISTRAYITVIGATMTIPLLVMSRMSTLEPMIALWAVAAFGGAGGGAALSPLSASVLRERYAAGVRGRAFGIVGAFMFLGVMVGGFVIGFWSERDHTAYRYYLPIAAALIVAAMALYHRITPARPRTGGWTTTLRGIWKPLAESVAVLKRDRDFREYEASYMSYGVGWMICTALLPLIGNDRLDLADDKFSLATVVVFQAAMIVLMFPAGSIADRVGPVRLVAASFVWLAIYPVMLMVVGSFAALSAATVIFAIGMVGVHLGWTLGPVHFAPTPDQAPRYMAVHGTLVGVRGIVFQGLGIWLYAATGGARLPLIIAAAGFLLAAWQMRRLGRRLH